MKKILIIVLIVSLILISGCYQTVQKEIIIEFDDTGSVLENKKLCYKLTEEHCDRIYNCKGFTFGEIICEDGKCIC